MPFTFFFHPVENPEPIEESTFGELNLCDLANLRKEISNVSLEHDKILATINRLAADHARVLQYTHALHFNRQGFEALSTHLQFAVGFKQLMLGYLTSQIIHNLEYLHSIDQQVSHQRQLADAAVRKKERLLRQLQEEQSNHRTYSIALLNDTRAYRHLLSDLDPIQIQDIIVTHPSMPTMGESRFPLEDDALYLGRMIKQISLLASFAKHHHHLNCTKEGKIKFSCENKITRVITDEFSFYPCQPLTIMAYQSLLREIHTIAKSLPLNIHLILASFPVIDTNSELHNVTLHVTSGPLPELHHHSKAIHSDIDVSYGYKLANNHSIPATPYMSQIHLEAPLLFSAGTILCSTTAGGARFINNIEICLEHNQNVGRDCLREIVRAAQLSDEVFPIQYSHVLSSRMTRILPSAPHNIRITQADATVPGLWIPSQDPRDYSSPIPEAVVHIANIFGTETIAHVFQPMQISVLPDDLFDAVADKNAGIMDTQLNIAAAPAFLLNPLF